MADAVEEHLQVNTATAGWQDCEISIEKIDKWREVNGFNIPPRWQQVKMMGRRGKVTTKWLAPNEAKYRLRMTSGDLEVRKRAAETEAAWHGCGTIPGTWVWRIEQFKVEAWDKSKYGKFHEGDSYIVLHTEKKREDNERLVYAVHFWIGKESTIDEQGTAAWKTTELDSYFNEEASQHREVQDGESDEFRSYFDNTLEYLPGGVPPGWRVRASDLRSDQLTQVWRDSKNVVRETEVPVTRESLNHRDAFLLATGDNIYVWFGESCTPFLRAAARNAATQLKRSLKKTCVKENVDDKFWDVLGGKGDITLASELKGGEQVEFGEGKLYEMQIDDTTNKVTWKVVKAYGDLHRSDFNETGVMVVDTRTEIYVWIGQEASDSERRNAYHLASTYLKTNGRDLVSICILKQGSDKDRTLAKWIEMFPLDS